MRFVTYNLRFDALPDDITVQESLDAQSGIDPLQEPEYLSLNGEQPWSLRRLRVAEILLKGNIIIAGFQEALLRQVLDLAELLGEEWKWIGVGRDDGIEKGEFCPIFYKHTKMTCISFDSFWLSETPFKPSKYPNAGSFRVCTVGRFATLQAGGIQPREFTILNTHLDDQSEKQRQLGASLLLRRARYEVATTKAPIFVLGDFNSSSNAADSAVYQIITGKIPPVNIPEDFLRQFPVNPEEEAGFKFLDLRAEVPWREISFDFATFTGFEGPNDMRNWSRIDFIFGGSNREWIAKAYDVKTSLFDDGVLASDHRPVFVDVILSPIQRY